MGSWIRDGAKGDGVMNKGRGEGGGSWIRDGAKRGGVMDKGRGDGGRGHG